MSITLRFDGASKGNPGPGGSAAVLWKNDEPLHACYYFHHRPVTCNIAEYYGLIGGLRMALAHGYKNIHVEGDSKLVMEQVFGTWNCTHPNMVPLLQEVREIKKQFASLYGRWIPREQNGEADKYANLAIFRKENQGHLDWFYVDSERQPKKKKTILEAFGITPHKVAKS